MWNWLIFITCVNAVILETVGSFIIYDVKGKYRIAAIVLDMLLIVFLYKLLF